MNARPDLLSKVSKARDRGAPRRGSVLDVQLNQSFEVVGSDGDDGGVEDGN